MSKMFAVIPGAFTAIPVDSISRIEARIFTVDETALTFPASINDSFMLTKRKAYIARAIAFIGSGKDEKEVELTAAKFSIGNDAVTINVDENLKKIFTESETSAEDADEVKKKIRGFHKALRRKVAYEANVAAIAAASSAPVAEGQAAPVIPSMTAEPWTEKDERVQNKRIEILTNFFEDQTEETEVDQEEIESSEHRNEFVTNASAVLHAAVSSIQPRTTKDKAA